LRNEGPRRRSELFISGIEATEPSEAPADYQALFEQYVTLFQRELTDWDAMGVLGRYDGRIKVLTGRIKAYRRSGAEAEHRVLRQSLA